MRPTRMRCNFGFWPDLYYAHHSESSEFGLTFSPTLWHLHHNFFDLRLSFYWVSLLPPADVITYWTTPYVILQSLEVSLFGSMLSLHFLILGTFSPCTPSIPCHLILFTGTVALNRQFLVTFNLRPQRLPCTFGAYGVMGGTSSDTARSQ